MGSFRGHALPGSFFIMFSLWWISQLPRRILLCRQESVPFFNTVTFPVPWGNLARIPIEGLVKVVGCSVGVLAELFASTDFGKEDTFLYAGNLQHATMYGFFLLSGLTDILTYRGVKLIPRGTDYLALTLAYVVEALLFNNHLHGRSSLDVVLHVLLLYVMVACAFTTIFEYVYDNWVILPFCRGFLTLLQGTWFYQVGFILYPPYPKMGYWEEENDALQLKVIYIFMCHCAACFLITSALYLFGYNSYKAHCRILDYDVEYQFISNPDGPDTWSRRRNPGFKMLYLRDVQTRTDEEDDSDDELSEVDVRA